MSEVWKTYPVLQQQHLHLFGAEQEKESKECKAFHHQHHAEGTVHSGQRPGHAG